MTDGRHPEPEHVAIIMDGNGRWAEARGLPRKIGHERGVESLRRVVDSCSTTGLSTLSVFSFSTENWKRPVSEVTALFALLRLYVKQDLNRLKSEGVRIRVIGSRNGLPDDILKLISMAETETEANSAFNLNIAFNYGAQEEILSACKSIAQACVDGKLTPDAISSELFQSYLWFGDMPAPDLLIRTSGEYRVSNFMLWQIAYSELVFVDCLWPDFGEVEFLNALSVYRNRDRRFGGLSAAVNQS